MQNERESFFGWLVGRLGGGHKLTIMNVNWMMIGWSESCGFFGVGNMSCGVEKQDVEFVEFR